MRMPRTSGPESAGRHGLYSWSTKWVETDRAEWAMERDWLRNMVAAEEARSRAEDDRVKIAV